jgi:hypothetical protein
LFPFYTYALCDWTGFVAPFFVSPTCFSTKDANKDFDFFPKKGLVDTKKTYKEVSFQRKEERDETTY